MNTWCVFKSRRGKNKNLSAQRSNSNTVWFNFQTYMIELDFRAVKYTYIYICVCVCGDMYLLNSEFRGLKLCNKQTKTRISQILYNDFTMSYKKYCRICNSQQSLFSRVNVVYIFYSYFFRDSLIQYIIKSITMDIYLISYIRNASFLIFRND